MANPAIAYSRQYQPEPANASGAVERFLPIVLHDGELVHRVQTRGISELSAMYAVTRKTFVKWLAPFKQELEERGYTPGQRKLNPACVRVIFDRLGEP